MLVFEKGEKRMPFTWSKLNIYTDRRKRKRKKACSWCAMRRELLLWVRLQVGFSCQYVLDRMNVSCWGVRISGTWDWDGWLLRCCCSTSFWCIRLWFVINVTLNDNDKVWASYHDKNKCNITLWACRYQRTLFFRFTLLTETHWWHWWQRPSTKSWSTHRVSRGCMNSLPDTDEMPWKNCLWYLLYNKYSYHLDMCIQSYQNALFFNWSHLPGLHVSQRPSFACPL